MSFTECGCHLLELGEQRPLTTIRTRLAALGDTLRPASMSWRFQFDTDCSDAFALLAASATLISPASTDNTSRVAPPVATHSDVPSGTSSSDQLTICEPELLGLSGTRCRGSLCGLGLTQLSTQIRLALAALCDQRLNIETRCGGGREINETIVD